MADVESKTMDGALVWRAAEEIPPEWYGGDLGELERLVEKLLMRRGRVRELIEEFGRSDREPFPKWEELRKVFVIVSFWALGVGLGLSVDCGMWIVEFGM